MSGVGAADTTLNPEDYKGFKLAIVAASWHTQVMDGLIDGAQRAARDGQFEGAGNAHEGRLDACVACCTLRTVDEAVHDLGARSRHLRAARRSNPPR